MYLNCEVYGVKVQISRGCPVRRQNANLIVCISTRDRKKIFPNLLSLQHERNPYNNYGQWVKFYIKIRARKSRTGRSDEGFGVPKINLGRTFLD